MQQKTALLLGATGLVGKSCLEELLSSAHYSRIIALTRRPLAINHPKLSNLVVDFENPASFAGQIAATDIFCALGSTIRHAGSKEAFRKIDYSYPFSIA